MRCSRQRSGTPGGRAKQCREILIADRGRRQCRAERAEPEGRNGKDAQRPRTQRHHHPSRIRNRRDASPVQQTRPQWRECDSFIYCRINVANALIAAAAAFPFATLRARRSNREPAIALPQTGVAISLTKRQCAPLNTACAPRQRDANARHALLVLAGLAVGRPHPGAACSPAASRRGACRQRSGTSPTRSTTCRRACACSTSRRASSSAIGNIWTCTSFRRRS